MDFLCTSKAFIAQHPEPGSPKLRTKIPEQEDFPPKEQSRDSEGARRNFGREGKARCRCQEDGWALG